ncbi:MAG: TatD family hydrolase, partial [Luteibaculum sp.]
HCHLYADQFSEDREAVLKKTRAAGVEKIILPNIDLNSVAAMHELSTQNQLDCYPMMGLHPCSVKETVKEDLAQIRALLFGNKEKYVGVGEIGIDLYWDKTFLEEQKDAFKEQCSWALELDMPIAIHVRDSFNEIFECLDEINALELKGIFHCFTGNREQANKALSYSNFFLGIGGVVTFKNSKLPEVLGAEVPLDRLVLETDSPYLAPHPHRGKRNSPEYIPLVAEKLMDVYDCSLKEIADISTKNCRSLFPQL